MKPHNTRVSLSENAFIPKCVPNLRKVPCQGKFHCHFFLISHPGKSAPSAVQLSVPLHQADIIDVDIGVVPIVKPIVNLKR